MKQPVYLDYAATSPVASEVAEAMTACLTMGGTFANPASRSHIYGWQAEEKVEVARRQVADLMNADAREIVWTSGATESNNLALKGVFDARIVDGHYSGHLITSVIEHKAVVDVAKWLESKGVAVTWLSPDSDGVISAQQVGDALREDTVLVSLMHINNETGVINPITEIGALCRDKGVLFHVDAAQSAGKVAIDNQVMNIDLLSLSAHKFYGPKGVGALFVRRAIAKQLQPIIHGGGHERGLRSGTLPTHQLVGMGEAAKLASKGLDTEMPKIAALRDQLWDGIKELPGVRWNCQNAPLSPIHLNVSMAGIDGETLLMSLRDIAVSSGSACTSASMEPSYVLKAVGLSDKDAHSSVRLSLGRYTTQDDIDRAITVIKKVVTTLAPGQ